MATVSECKSQQDAPAKVDHNFLSKPTSHLRRPIKSLPIVVSEESGLCTDGYVCGWANDYILSPFASQHPYASSVEAIFARCRGRSISVFSTQVCLIGGISDDVANSAVLSGGCSVLIL